MRKQAVGIEGIGGKDHPHSRRVSKQHFAGLRVIERAACEISADCHAHHGRRRECIIRAPAHRRQLIAQLVHRGPDVIEELNLHHRLHAPGGDADCPSDDVCLGQRRIEDAVGAILALQPGGQLEDAAFALDCAGFQIFLAATVRHIFAEDDDALIALHLILEAER